MEDWDMETVRTSLNPNWFVIILLSFYHNSPHVELLASWDYLWVWSVQVDALQGHRVIDVACGSGDAQTLCLTDDDMVWSWGDGDYGKLGRGGSDGCKVPMKVKKQDDSCRFSFQICSDIVSGQYQYRPVLKAVISVLYQK